MSAIHICPHCEIGHLHIERRTHVRIYQGMVLSAPNMPVYHCDVCGYEEYEPAAYRDLNTLVGASDPNRNGGSNPVKPAAPDTPETSVPRHREV